MTITLPWPPSVNRYYRSINGRQILSKTGRQYKKDVAYLLAEYCIRYGLPMHGDLRVSVEYFPPSRRKYDIDNFLKALLDALEVSADQLNGAYVNDSQIIELHVSKGGAVGKPGKVIVRITEE